jgi:hypothetical protein
LLFEGGHDEFGTGILLYVRLRTPGRQFDGQIAERLQNPDQGIQIDTVKRRMFRIEGEWQADLFKIANR